MPLTEAFVFYSRLHLIELTGIVVSTLPELLEQLKTVNGSCIYHHTHHFIQQHQHLSPEPANDFAYWVTESLGDKQLGEELASIDIMSFRSIRAIRDALIEVIEKGLSSRSRLKKLSAPEGERFSFLKSVSFIFPTEHRAADLAGFVQALKDVSIDSVYYHMFESRLRLERSTNDFSKWLSETLGQQQLAVKIAKLDPYTRTGENLRAQIIELDEQRIKEEEKNK